MRFPVAVAASAVAFAAVAATTFTSSSAQAQDAMHQPVPSISSAGHYEVKVSPDRATISIGVQTRAATAAAAGADNAKKQTAILAALRAQGLPNERLSTTGYTVQPEYKYEQNKEPQIVGYSVTNTILADIRDLSKIGSVLDAALGAGANQISSLDFYASNTDAARQTAITNAVARARAEAHTAATAAGGSLGELLEMNVSGGSIGIPPRPMYKGMMAAADVAAPTPINPGEQSVDVNVSTRWRFVAGTGAR